MIESQNQPGVYYILPGELVPPAGARRVAQGFKTPGWFYLPPGADYDGPYSSEAHAIDAARQHTKARTYKENKK